MNSDLDKFTTGSGRIPTHQPPDGEFHAVLPKDLAQATKPEQEGDGPPVRKRKGTLPVRISGIE